MLDRAAQGTNYFNQLITMTLNIRSNRTIATLIEVCITCLARLIAYIKRVYNVHDPSCPPLTPK